MKKPPIFFIYLGAFFISFSYGLFLSLPLFIKYLGGNEKTTGLLLGLSGMGTIAAVLLSKRLLKKIKGKSMAMIGGIAYGLGSLGFLASHDLGLFLLISILLIGAGWGFYFNAASYTLSLLTNDGNRSALFSYLSAFGVLGTGIAPVLIKWIWGLTIAFPVVFYTAAFTSFLSALCFYAVKIEQSFVNAHPHGLKASLYEVKSNATKYPIAMVFLGACAFSMMLNFQTTYANAIGMNYAYFYTAYSLAVVASRFLLGQYLGSFNQYKLAIFLLVMMVIALLLFLLSPFSPYLYIMNAILFGISYGLVYPTIQSITVGLSKAAFRADILSYFSLAYFIGVYAFPPLGGYLIVYLGYNSLIICIALLAMVELVLAIVLCKKVADKR